MTGEGDSPERQILTAQDADALRVIAGLLHDAGVKQESLHFGEPQGEVRFRAWRLSEQRRNRPAIWPLRASEHAQVETEVTIRGVRSVQFDFVTSTDTITDIVYREETGDLVLTLFASKQMVLGVTRLDVEVRDVGDPSFEGPNTIVDLGLRGGRWDAER